MMSSDGFEHARGIAARQLVEGFDLVAGQKFPYRAKGYEDLWPGDRWTEAYLAIGNIGLAERAYSAVLNSIHDGVVPHLMQGSHKRLGIETRGIDRQVYRATGVGVTISNSGERVTRLHAQPSWALGALALFENALAAPDNSKKATAVAALYSPILIRATHALYKVRGREDGLVVSTHRDEMTNNSGFLASQDMPQTDPAVNALLVQNNAAVLRLANVSGYELPGHLSEKVEQTQETLTKMVDLHAGYSMPEEPEFVLAAARLGMSTKINKTMLNEIFAAPAPKDKHPEKTHLSMAECIEIAKLTPERPESREYLARIYAGIADGQPITRLEDKFPGRNTVSKKIGRKLGWLPTAAAIVMQFSPSASDTYL